MIKLLILTLKSAETVWKEEPFFLVLLLLPSAATETPEKQRDLYVFNYTVDIILL